MPGPTRAHFVSAARNRYSWRNGRLDDGSAGCGWVHDPRPPTPRPPNAHWTTRRRPFPRALVVDGAPENPILDASLRPVARAPNLLPVRGLDTAGSGRAGGRLVGKAAVPRD